MVLYAIAVEAGSGTHDIRHIHTNPETRYAGATGGRALQLYKMVIDGKLNASVDRFCVSEYIKCNLLELSSFSYYHQSVLHGAWST